MEAPNPSKPPGNDVAEELRLLGQSFSSLGRTMFREGRALTAELLRSTRSILDRAREEIERLTGDGK